MSWKNNECCISENIKRIINHFQIILGPGYLEDVTLNIFDMEMNKHESCDALTGSGSWVTPDSQLGDVPGQTPGQSLQVFVAAAYHWIHTRALTGTLWTQATAPIVLSGVWRWNRGQFHSSTPSHLCVNLCVRITIRERLCDASVHRPRSESQALPHPAGGSPVKMRDSGIVDFLWQYDGS